MPEQLQVQFSLAAATLYALIRNSAGEVWNGAAFEEYATANLGTYDIALTEQGTASRFYAVDMPVLTPGLYNVVIFRRAGASPAETDSLVASGSTWWDGSAFIVPAVAGAAMTLTSAERNAVADAHLDRADAIEVGLTPRGAHRLAASAAAAKLSGAGTNTVTLRNAVADSKDRIVATTDEDGNRTAVTTDVT